MICEGLNPDVVTGLNYLTGSLSWAVYNFCLALLHHMNFSFKDLWIVLFSPLDFRSTKVGIAETTHVLGSLERVWSNSAFLTKDQLATLPANHGKI